ncbi:MAG: DUF86 domain-containing protein [Flavobacteriia bacterium]|nr:DUF86 domain-containing protein [Flavobacteriia bacterium]
MMEQVKKYLSDILQAIKLIEDFTSNTFDYNDFDKDKKTQSAVERQLSIIGEAANKIDKNNPSFNLQNTRKIVGFRNRLIHYYDSMDSSIIWAILKIHIPLLKNEILKKM